MQRLSVLSLVLIVSLAVGAAPSRPPGPDNPPAKDDKKDDRPKPRLPAGHELMRAKLKHSQAVLEGLALADFKRIGAAADELVQVSQGAEFLNAYKSREYEIQVQLFRRSAETVSRKAKDRNLDGVTLAYLDMTLSCVKCHQHTRDTKGDARLPTPPGAATAAK
jgi:hypothetical protein